jgi:hypothetical protein
MMFEEKDVTSCLLIVDPPFKHSNEIRILSEPTLSQYYRPFDPLQPCIDDQHHY